MLQNLLIWKADPDWILNSRTRLYGEQVFKFCYEPTTRKLWLGHGRQSHKEILNVKSWKNLNRVIRGIYFRRQKIVYLRDHPNKRWLLQTEAMLAAKGLPNGYLIVWGREPVKKLAKLLEGL